MDYYYNASRLRGMVYKINVRLRPSDVILQVEYSIVGTEICSFKFYSKYI